MLDMMTPLITEADMVSQELLDAILVNIIEPYKVNIFSFYYLPTIIDLISHIVHHLATHHGLWVFVFQMPLFINPVHHIWSFNK